MIKTQLTREDALQVLALGKMLHEESQYSDRPFNAERIWSILDATLQRPDTYFIVYDDQFRGLLLMQMSTEFFSGEKWVGDLAFYVAPEARKQGLADELLAVGKKWAKDNGALDLTIIHNAGIGLEQADHYYLKRGFKLSGKVYSTPLNSDLE
jgi:GNAT superfamily N-acetyltransferase